MMGAPYEAMQESDWMDVPMGLRVPYVEMSTEAREQGRPRTGGLPAQQP